VDSSNTKIQIINKALSHIKKRNINSLTEQTEEARKSNLFYDCARRSCLRLCNWQWARAQKALNLLGDQETAIANPTDASKQDVIPQWNYLYKYPADCVKLINVFNDITPVIPDP
jgi:hypothetical protein